MTMLIDAFVTRNARTARLVREATESDAEFFCRVGELATADDDDVRWVYARTATRTVETVEIVDGERVVFAAPIATWAAPDRETALRTALRDGWHTVYGERRDEFFGAFPIE